MSRRAFLSASLAGIAGVALFWGACGSGTGTHDQGGADGGDDAGADAAGAALAGVVRDKAGAVVLGAKIEVGGSSAYSDAQGKYVVAVTAAGPATINVTRPWFIPFQTTVTVAASGTTMQDLTIEEIPLKLEPADVALAQSFARTFNWATSKTSIAVAAKPTRRDFDNAVFFRNPALYKDTSQQAPVTPPALPEITASGAKNFSFPLRSGKNQGQEALDLSSIVDSLAATKLAPADAAQFMVWMPMLAWLGEWDQGKAADLNAAAVAIRQQNWGGSAPNPQAIDRVYLDAATGALWAEVVFGNFVQLGSGITDDDGDGRKEIYARIAGVHVASDLAAKLGNDYGKTTFSTHGLSMEIGKSLNELYSSTAAQVERYIGQPFEVPAVGTITYPFVVLRHSGGQKNVILVAPAAP